MKCLLGILILTLMCVGNLHAADDICAAAGSYVRSTASQIDAFADRRVNQRSFEGSGRVKDVKSGGLASKYTVIVDCGNNVLAEVPTSSSRASDNLQIGESVSFSGTANGIYRRRYVNTHSYYLLVSFNDNSSVW